MQRVLARSWAGSSPGRIPGALLQSYRQINTRVSREAAAASLLLSLPGIGDADLSFASQGMYAPSGYGKAMAVALQGLWTGDAGSLWDLARAEWMVEHETHIKLSSEGGMSRALAVEAGGSSLGMPRETGMHPDDEDYEGPEEMDEASDMARYLLQQSTSSKDAHRDERETETVAARALVFV